MTDLDKRSGHVKSERVQKDELAGDPMRFVGLSICSEHGVK